MNYLLPAQAAGQFLSLFVFATLARWYVVPWLKTEDVDQERIRFKDLVREFVLEPTTQPWGNRSMLFRDPDGNLINFYAPLSRVQDNRQAGVKR